MQGKQSTDTNQQLLALIVVKSCLQSPSDHPDVTIYTSETPYMTK
jgi:hypothetical protein